MQSLDLPVICVRFDVVMSQAVDKPEVSIIVLNLNGRKHLDGCFSSLESMNYDRDRIEFILVDNGSNDGSVEYMRYRFPGVKVIANSRNLGFCVACNLGARAARGEYVVFLNNDMRVDENWLEPLIEAVRSGETDCATSLILSWDGSCVNFGGAGANFHGIGFQQGINDPDVEKYKERKQILFACGGSMAIRKDLFCRVNGFDDSFFAYFEDVDFGWRLWVMGYRVLFVPESTAYHHHSATSKLMDVHKLRVLHIRNPLYAIFKNYSYENLMKVFPAALMLTLKRTVYLTGISDKSYLFNGKDVVFRGPVGELITKLRSKIFKEKVEKTGMADIIALNQFIDNFAGVMKRREAIQSMRKRPDEEILPLFKDPFWAVEQPAEYDESLRLFADFFGFSKIFDQ